MRRSCFLAPAVLGLLWAGLVAAAPEALLRGEGTVVGVEQRDLTVTVDHGPIRDLLPAMRTTFPVVKPEVLRAIRVGDRITFIVAPADDLGGILAIWDIELHPPWSVGQFVTALGARDAMLASLFVLLVVLLTVTVLLYRQTARVRTMLAQTQERVLARVDEQRHLSRQMAAAVDALVQTLGLALRVGSELQRLTERIERSRGSPVADGAATVLPLVVVRIGDAETYEVLEQRLARPRLARVIWDRRQAERRVWRRSASGERRRRERRALPPLTWATLGYLVVESRPRRFTVVA